MNFWRVTCTRLREIHVHNYAGGAQLGAATVFGRIVGNELAARAKRAK